MSNIFGCLLKLFAKVEKVLRKDFTKAKMSSRIMGKKSECCANAFIFILFG